MYRLLQMVVYGIHGVCRVLELEDRIVDKKAVTYYVLEPVSQPGARFYIPSHNAAAMAKLRPLTQKEALQQMLSDRADVAPWIPDENQRKQHYRQFLGNMDAKELVRMIRCLEAYRLSQAQLGRKLHICDENFLRDAKRILTSEISYVLELDEKDVSAHLMEMIL